MNRPAAFKRRANKMATEDVWPWSYLVPWFVQEIRTGCVTGADAGKGGLFDVVRGWYVRYKWK